MLSKALALAATAALVPVTTAVGSIVDLGLAGDYAAFATNHIDMTISSGNTLVTGNVGVGPGGQLDFSGGGLITGRLDHHPDASINISGGSQVLGGANPMDMTQADADANFASVTARGKSPTQVFGNLTGGTIVGGGGYNIINVDNINLSGGDSLSLSGSASDVFIVNVFGDFMLDGGSIIDLIGDLDASQVLFNVVDPGSEVKLTGNSTLYGTLLAPDRNITVSGGFIEGAVIGCGDFLKLQSGPTVVYNGFSIPAPSAVALLALAGVRRRRRRD